MHTQKEIILQNVNFLLKQIKNLQHKLETTPQYLIKDEEELLSNTKHKLNFILDTYPEFVI